MGTNGGKEGRVWGRLGATGSLQKRVVSVCLISRVSCPRVLCVVCEIFLTSKSASRSLLEEQMVIPHSLGLVSTRTTWRDA